MTHTKITAGLLKQIALFTALIAEEAQGKLNRGKIDELKGDRFVASATANIPLDLREIEEIDFSVITDNWMPPGARSLVKEDGYPIPSSSFGLQGVDTKTGEIVCGSLSGLFPWAQKSVVFGPQGASVLTKDGVFSQIKKANSKLLVDDPGQTMVFLFAQKRSEERAVMNKVIAAINKQGYRGFNDCGWIYLLQYVFSNFNASTGSIMLYNIMYSESLCNREENKFSLAFIRALAESAGIEITMTDIIGDPVFDDGLVRNVDTPQCKLRCGIGYTIGTGPKESYAAFMRVFKSAVLSEPDIMNSDNKRLKKLREDFIASKW